MVFIPSINVSQVGIVVNGELQCLNTCLSIKNHYGSGIRLELELSADWKGTGRLQRGDKERVIKFVADRLHPQAVLTEEVASRLFFTLPVGNKDLGRLFNVLSDQATENGIKDYALSQPTLDQVFAVFAKRQAGVAAPG